MDQLVGGRWERWQLVEVVVVEEVGVVIDKVFRISSLTVRKLQLPIILML